MELSQLLIVLGSLFLLGLVADWISSKVLVPRASLMLFCGIVVGKSGFDLIPQEITALYETLSVIALSMVAFLLGGSLTPRNLAQNGRAILSLSFAIVLITVVGVSVMLWLVGVPLEAAVVLGAIATATDPAATQDAIRQAGSKSIFAERLKGIVTIDDAWGLITFALAIVVARALAGEGWQLTMLTTALWELGGAVAVGLMIGLPAAFLTGRVKPGEPLKAEALGIVLLTAGLSIQLDVSFLLSGMVAGAVIRNLASHHKSAFHEIEELSWPFILLFFILAGATLDSQALITMGYVGLVYFVSRILARIAGGWIGGILGGLTPQERRLYGIALLPQAGVAVGMALVAAQVFPEHQSLIQTVVIATTVLFEILGPIFTYLAVRRMNTTT